MSKLQTYYYFKLDFTYVIFDNATYPHRVDSRLAPSQWDTALQSNAVSHWLGANLEAALPPACTIYNKQHDQF